MTTLERFGRSGAALIAVALMSLVVVAFAQKAPIETDVAGLAQRTDSFSRICAQRDLQLVILIEELGDAQGIAGHKLSDAALGMIRARKACNEGRESMALSIYDTVTLDLTPTRAAR